MNLNISGHHLALTQPLRAYVKEKLKRVERHFDHLIEASVILTVDKLEQQGRGHAPRPRRQYARGQAIAPDMYAAIDGLIDKLDQQTRKFKDKIRDHHAREAPKHLAI